MNPIFSIKTKDIKSLNDVQSRELVARLCRAELRKLNISENFVLWGGDQRAKDGGVDVLVNIDPPQSIIGYIKSDRTIFQVKAENFSKSKIPEEMAPNGSLRPAIRELAINNGAYIIVSTRDDLSSGSAYSDRINAMESCLSLHGINGEIIVDFYDCRRIADWIEQNPPIAIWVRSVLGKPLVGWKPYSPWAYQESDLDAEYLLDDRVKVFTPNSDEGSAVLFSINQLRENLSKASSVRIVGLSGVGKTRLVQALFDKRILTEQPALDAENVIYTDFSDGPTPQPSVMVETLVAEGADCVVVVDNCGHSVHRKLSEIVNRLESKIRLITIEYDIRNDIPEGTTCYRLESSSDDVICKLLKRRFKVLSDGDIDKIVEFSDGNARVSFALAASTESTGELARLRDTDLFDRLFFQNNNENDELMRCAEAASLLYSFDGVDCSSNSEMSILASLVEMPLIAFSRNITLLQSRGLVQQRGKWRAVLPHAISNRLAKQAIDEIPVEFLISKLVVSTNERVAQSFSRRLSFLHESTKVCDIVLRWLEPEGRYSDLTSFSDIEKNIFKNIAPIQQESALRVLERAVSNSSFVSSDKYDLYFFTKIARSLAYETYLFERAAEVIVQLSVDEPPDKNYESSTNVLTSLFYCHLSGTEASPCQRAKVIKSLMLSSIQGRQRLSLDLLRASFETSYFSSIYDFDFGARRRDYGWHPLSEDDLYDWYKQFIDISVEFGKENTKFAQAVRTVLAESLRGLWMLDILRQEIIRAINELTIDIHWPEGWHAVLGILHFDKETLDEENILILQRLGEQLAPDDLKTKIYSYILPGGSFSYSLDDYSEHCDGNGISKEAISIEEAAEDLGKQASLDNEILAEVVPKLLTGSANQYAWNFGFGIGQTLQAIERVIKISREFIEHSNKESYNFTFFSGIIVAWQKTNPEQLSIFLDKILDDSVWRKWFPTLQLQVEIDELGYKRLIKSLELGYAPVNQYRRLCYGGAKKLLLVAQIMTLLDIISEKSEDGINVVIEIMFSVLYDIKEKSIEFSKELRKSYLSFLKRTNLVEHYCKYRQLSSKMDRIFDFIINDSEFSDELSALLENTIKTANEFYSYRVVRILQVFVRYFPKQTFDMLFAHTKNSKLFLGLRDRESVELFRYADEKSIIEWCNVYPNERYAFIASICPLFVEIKSHDKGTNPAFNLTSLSIALTINASDKKSILTLLANKLYPMSGAGRKSKELEMRLIAFEKLNISEDVELSEQFAKIKEFWLEKIKKEEELEEIEEKRQTASFE